MTSHVYIQNSECLDIYPVQFLAL